MTDPCLWQRRLVNRQGEARRLVVQAGQAWVDGKTSTGEALDFDAQLASELRAVGGTWSMPDVVPALLEFKCTSEGCDWSPHRPQPGDKQEQPATCESCESPLDREPVLGSGVLLTLVELVPPSELWLAEEAFNRKPNAGTARLLCEAAARDAGLTGSEIAECTAALAAEIAKLPRAALGRLSNTPGNAPILLKAVKTALRSPHYEGDTHAGTPKSLAAASKAQGGADHGKAHAALVRAGLRPRETAKQSEGSPGE